MSQRKQLWLVTNVCQNKITQNLCELSQRRAHGMEKHLLLQRSNHLTESQKSLAHSSPPHALRVPHDGEDSPEHSIARSLAPGKAGC